MHLSIFGNRWGSSSVTPIWSKSGRGNEVVSSSGSNDGCRTRTLRGSCRSHHFTDPNSMIQIASRRVYVVNFADRFKIYAVTKITKDLG